MLDKAENTSHKNLHFSLLCQRFNSKEKKFSDFDYKLNGMINYFLLRRECETFKSQLKD